ncbi:MULTISPECIES: hypothetical protein [Parachlamydia]|jgi:hypothetical protein|uniref:Peptidase M23 domain-containing protein n=2 Tax=Parachlamydia acanthamoebae TaxID=83552 RepID=F8KYJ9_PARAV|nr:hypothetical protein [Parachlamydia acanthamoebae]EFB41184.1 hypothetical protein pah_c050o177 [Parachlamydia acanthamoebae str. Hall's coccus]KIA78313.1 hypothetical protein DB43_EH00020 [Parachlamydia acanthamoebae]CCB85954.1 putative uncharacterized protein [Parachlamydia acanthamoebae UV-7]
MKKIFSLFLLLNFISFFAFCSESKDLSYHVEGMGIFPEIEYSPERSVSISLDIVNQKITDIKIDHISKVAKELLHQYPIKSDYIDSHDFNIYYYHPVASQGGKSIAIHSIKMPNEYQYVGWGHYLEEMHWIRGKGPIVIGTKAAVENLQAFEQTNTDSIFQGDIQYDSNNGTIAIIFDHQSKQFSGHLYLHDEQIVDFQGAYSELSQEKLTGKIFDSGNEIGQLDFMFFGDSNPEIGGIFDFEQASLGKIKGIFAVRAF